MVTRTVDIPLNRVEGDLEVRADLDGGVVVDARCAGTLFRGFERILVGRGALDGLVLTPRVCGICSVSHLTAAVLALESAAAVAPAPAAVRVRNVVLIVEQLQSDVRQAFLTYSADFANPGHARCDLHPEAVRRYEPFRGATVVEVVRESKRLLEVAAILGGQFPHSSFMVPGGIASLPSTGDIVECRLLVSNFRRWYERRILGCTIERLSEVRSEADLDAWLGESDAHRESDLGFFIRFSRAAGLDGIGRGHASFLSFGGLDLPAETGVRAPRGGGRLVAAGFAQGTSVAPFDPRGILEHVSHSWYADEGGARHPSVGETRPFATGAESAKYSWAKAPRYQGHPAETGPLAEAILGRDPLFTDLVDRRGPTAFARQLARIVRGVVRLPALETWLEELVAGGRTYTPPGELARGEGAGLTQASRGALGHWLRLEDGKIAHYQIITPTGWNASPRDTQGVRGPIEEALVGTRVADPENPVELGHVVRSFDPCLVCTVHVIDRGRERGRLRVGTGLVP